MYNFEEISAQKKLNNKATAIEVPKAFLDKFPTLLPGRAEKHFRIYITQTINMLLPKLPFLTDGETYLSTKKLTDSCGTFNDKGRRYSIWNAFKDIYPLINVVKTGSNIKHTDNPYEKNTRVKIVNERLIEMIIAGSPAKEVFDHFFTRDDIENRVTHVVHIDMDNLRRYIESTEYEIEKAENEKHINKLKGSLWQAKIIEKIGQHTALEYDDPMLPHIPKESPFGRINYSGMNIQNVAKEVRSAIIGRHFQYDMNAAVFAIKLRLYGDVCGGDNVIVGTSKGSYTREYLENKKSIRQRLARDCFEGVNLPFASKVKGIKNALTAIGFGAKTSGKMWMTATGLKGSALTDILIAPKVRSAFLDDPWVKAFLAEQKQIEDAILEAAAQEDGYEVMCDIIARESTANGKVSRGQRLAYLYQHYEAHVMNEAISVLERFDINVIARIHDAFIVREKLSPRVMDEIAAVWGHRSYMAFDCEEVPEWTEASYKRARDEADKREAEHREEMLRGEQQARLYAFKKRAI